MLCGGREKKGVENPLGGPLSPHWHQTPPPLSPTSPGSVRTADQFTPAEATIPRPESDAQILPIRQHPTWELTALARFPVVLAWHTQLPDHWASLSAPSEAKGHFLQFLPMCDLDKTP